MKKKKCQEMKMKYDKKYAVESQKKRVTGDVK